MNYKDFLAIIFWIATVVCAAEFITPKALRPSGMKSQGCQIKSSDDSANAAIAAMFSAAQ